MKIKTDALSVRLRLCMALEHTARLIREAPSPIKHAQAHHRLFRLYQRSQRVLDYWLKHSTATRKGGRHDLRRRRSVFHPGRGVFYGPIPRFSSRRPKPRTLPHAETP